MPFRAGAETIAGGGRKWKEGGSTKVQRNYLYGWQGRTRGEDNEKSEATALNHFEYAASY